MLNPTSAVEKKNISTPQASSNEHSPKPTEVTNNRHSRIEQNSFGQDDERRQELRGRLFVTNNSDDAHKDRPNVEGVDDYNRLQNAFPAVTSRLPVNGVHDGNYNSGYQNVVEEDLIKMKDKFYNDLLDRYYHDSRNDPNIIERKYNKIRQSDLLDDYDNGYHGHTALDRLAGANDVLTYNPIFDYLRRTSSHNTDRYKSTNPGGVVRQIQHYQTVYQPNQLYLVNRNRFNNDLMTHPVFLTGENNQNNYYPETSFSDQGTPQDYLLKYRQAAAKGENYAGAVPKRPSAFPRIPNGQTLQKIYDDYFPIVIQNPFNAMWTAFTNVIEYGPEADVCKSKQSANKKLRRRSRDARKEEFKAIEIQENDDDDDDEDEETVDVEEEVPDAGTDVTQEFMADDLKIFPFSRPTPSSASYEIPVPNIRRLKVRKGGVAIAGPGGIATAGSGGTAIVGPGGTAYTKQDGTAIVGPGGRLVHVPEHYTFPFIKKIIGNKNKLGEPRTFSDPPGSKFIAMGPVIYYNVQSTENPDLFSGRN